MADPNGQTIESICPDLIPESWNSNEDGSNAILLVGKKKRKSNQKAPPPPPRPPPLSKSKQRKLRQLQAEKEKKQLQSKSIEILEKCKIWDGAYSLLHSSGTIGKAETMREKRLRAVQFSQAGMEVPQDVLPFRKGKPTRHEDDDTLDIDPVESQCEDDDTLEIDPVKRLRECGVEENDPLPVKRMRIDDCNGGLPLRSCPEITSESPSDIKPPPSAKENIEKGASLVDNKKNLGVASSNYVRRKDSDSQDHAADHPNVYSQSSVVPLDSHVNGPTVVHVSRPNDVEEKRKDLPIIMMEQEIMEAINEHSIVILCGETGCGKTTQVPQFLYEAGFGSKNRSDRKGIIGVTQPRRVAVLATAKRVSFELGLRLGREVGFQVRHDKLIGDGCSIKFMTDGILLREVQSDFLLRRYSVIILDEAHERSLNTDILVGMLSRIINLRKKLYMEQQEKILSGMVISPEDMVCQLKLVLMSATLRVEDFISGRKLFLETPPVLEVPVRQYPVTIHFTKKTQEDYLGQAYKKVMSIHKRLPQGGILVFVTGQREVEQLCKKLRKASKNLTGDNHTTTGLGADMQDINEAFDVGSSDRQNDRFNSYEEDDDNIGFDSYSSGSEAESDLESDSDDDECIKPEGGNNLELDFLAESVNLSSLKASFEALAGNSSTQDNKEKPNPDGSIKEEPEPTAKSAGALYVVPLYAMLPASAQLRVFDEVPEGERLVVVATNVAETSLTIPGIKYVVDTGKGKVKNYNYSSGMATYEVQWISRASAAQRAGRAGRTGPGHCYRLYSSAAFSKDDIFPDFSCPEISKIPVDGVVLLMKFMGIDKVANFPFPTPPETEALREAEHCLKALEALDDRGSLTPLGRAMAQYPMSPRHSRMLLTVIQIMKNQQGYARANFVLGYAVAAAAAVSFSNPFTMQFGGSRGTADDMDQEERHDAEKHSRKKLKTMAKEVRARFSNPSSDALTIAYALQLFELAEDPVKFCSINSLHLKTMEDMSKLRKQLLQLIFHQSKMCQEFSWDNGSFEDVECSWRNYSSKHPLKLNEEELMGQAICAGWADRVAKRTRTVSVSSENDHKVRAVRYQSNALKDIIFLHRSSSISQSAPEFLVYAELLHARRPYMYGATRVKPEWLMKYASSLCSFSAPLTDPKPYYEPLSDQVLCWVSPTFGHHNWNLPLHSVPMKNDTTRVSVFGCALLEGSVLPCLRSAQKYLAGPPSSILKPGALGQRRIGDLVNKLKIGSRTIDSRALLREAWDSDPQVLYLEIKNWFQPGFHRQFGELWKQMQLEVLQEGLELFSKRAKKDRKKGKH